MATIQKGGEKIGKKYLSLILIISLILIGITSVNAADDANQTLNMEEIEVDDSTDVLSTPNTDLESRISNAKNGEKILIEPGTYKIHNVMISKNITLQGKGNPDDIIIDGEKKSSIFLIRSPDVYVTFKNITFINGLTDNFGGAISIETGHVTVDNCIFINNTALENTNAGGISNYGTKEDRGYLMLTNSLFLNNHADHDGGAVTTCYADSYIYNCVFINNSARRDGGAIRVSISGYGHVEDCIFMFNHADEWGGAYYSWSGESDIRRCIFMNNTAGTNGGAVMVSGNINLQDSIIVNNDGGEVGGSFYIQQPMYNKKTVINVHDNIITNNTSPLGKEIFISWKNTENLYTQFDNNDWGDEDPNNSSIIDPKNVTSRSKVSKTIKSNLFERLNVNLLDKYQNYLKDFFPDDSLNDLKKQFKNPEPSQKPGIPSSNIIDDVLSVNNTNTVTIPSQTAKQTANVNNIKTVGNSSSVGSYDKSAYELDEKPSASKETNLDLKYVIIFSVLALLLLIFGYKIYKKEE